VTFAEYNYLSLTLSLSLSLSGEGLWSDVERVPVWMMLLMMRRAGFDHDFHPVDVLLDGPHAQHGDCKYG